MTNFSYKNCKSLHLELTTKCNAMCPMCNRNFAGKVRTGLQLVELSLDDCKKIFNDDFLKKMEYISLCGVFGDPLANTQLLDILTFFFSKNPNITINIYTNGNFYNKTWWKKLAKTLKNGTVIFGIDGLESIHEIHRRGTKFNRIIENAKAFIKAGGNAQWDYIVFRHNEHQVDEAKKLSEELGFKCFQIKKTSRFFKTLYEKDKKLDSTFIEYGKHPIFNSQGKIIDYLELPTKRIYRNDEENNINKLIKKYGTYNNYLIQAQIDCKAIQSGGIFISAFGEVFPCCTVYQQVCYKSVFHVNDKEELNEYNIYKKYNVSAINQSIEGIIEGGFFKEIAESFTKKDFKSGKCKSCARTCSAELDIHGGVHKGVL